MSTPTPKPPTTKPTPPPTPTQPIVVPPTDAPRPTNPIVEPDRPEIDRPEPRRHPEYQPDDDDTRRDGPRR